ncbi:MAG: 20S proteasome subunit A/B, partial [Xanthomonadales bacterium]|nr:20S proteasome subunit A/B [Xanthomonadales bacterium]
MIEEPYRWIEAIRNRREYIETQLERGSPLVLLGFDEGLLLFTLSGETRKLFEVYDRIGFAALGHPADIERMRLAAIDLAHV